MFNNSKNQIYLTISSEYSFAIVLYATIYMIWHTFYYPYHLLHLVYISFFKWINPLAVYIYCIYTITLVYYLTYRQWRICMIDENCCSTIILLFCPYNNLLKLLFGQILYLPLHSSELHHDLNCAREYYSGYLKSKNTLAI